MREGYYRFSKILDKPRWLDKWFDCFQKRGINCFIVKHHERGYALWREGKDCHFGTAYAKRIKADRYPSGEVVREWSEKESAGGEH